MGIVDSYIHVYFRHRPDHIVSIKKGSAMPGVSGDTLPGISFEDMGGSGEKGRGGEGVKKGGEEGDRGEEWGDGNKASSPLFSHRELLHIHIKTSNKLLSPFNQISTG